MSGCLDKRNVEDILPLTAMQEGMLFQYLKDPGSQQYFQQLILSVQGYIDIDAFKAAWNFVLMENEMLRTVFRWERLSHPVQVVLKSFEAPVRFYDFINVEEHDKENSFNEIISKDKLEKADIGIEPFRITLCRYGQGTYKMIISNHHIIYDGWSTGVILNEFLHSYDMISEGGQPERQNKSKFRDFIKFCRKQDNKEQEKFWREYLKGFKVKTPLPCDKVIGRYEEFNLDIHFCNFDTTLIQTMHVFAMDNSMTFASVMYTAWGILLLKYTQTEDVVFGTTISGRTAELSGIENTVGLFINTLPLRIRSSRAIKVKNLIAAVNDALKERESYSSTPLNYVKLFSEMEGKDNVFDSIVVIRNYPLDSGLGSRRNKLAVSLLDITEMANFELIFVISDFDNVNEINWAYLKYNSSEFEEKNIQILEKHFSEILEQIAAKPDIRVEEIVLSSQWLTVEETAEDEIEFNF